MNNAAIHLLYKYLLELLLLILLSIYPAVNCWITWTSLATQLVKNPPEMQETPVQFLGQEYPLEKGEATHSSIPGLP